MPWAQFDEDGNFRQTTYPILRCVDHGVILCGGIGAGAYGVVWSRDTGPERSFRERGPTWADTPVACGDRQDDFGMTCAELGQMIAEKDARSDD